eukprot:SAG31_NODE_43731_length_265_cov_14.771084_1_plen_32_part_01
MKVLNLVAGLDVALPEVNPAVLNLVHFRAHNV